MIITSIVVHAGGIEYFKHVTSLYNSGRYEEALQGFKSCKSVYYKEFNTEQINKLNTWIGMCQRKISEKNAAKHEKRKADIAKAKRKANEAKLAEERKAYEAKQLERIEKKLLFISSNAFLINEEYSGMHQAIKGHIAKNSDFKFTDDPNKAYWSVYVTANAYKYRQNISKETNKKTYYSRAIAYIKIVDEINHETIYEGEIESSQGDFYDYNDAARKAYTHKKNGLNIKIATEILNYIK